MTPTDEARLALALAEFLDRSARGEKLNLEEFCQAHPECGPALREQLNAAGELDTLGGASPPPLRASLPERLSGHRVVRELGSGGMGRVYLAIDERLGRQVAIKTLKPGYRENPELRERFLEEARALARISHPHVVRIYGLGPGDEEPHFVMEYVEGVPLHVAARKLDLRGAVALFRQVVAAVGFLHQNQLLHRDLKPGNVLVDSAGQPKLLDFGLALAIRDPQRLTREGAVIGTPAYLSPEQASGARDLDARSDLFSLGAVLYELLTGALPFPDAGHSDPVLPRRLNPSIPGTLQNICLKALERDAALRYASAVEFGDDLDRFLAGEPVLAMPAAYGRMLEGQREQHLREIRGWHQDRIITDGEYDTLRRGYARLDERRDAWILEMRRLSLSHVSLYLGAWLLVTTAALVAVLASSGIRGWPAMLVALAATAPTGVQGVRLWKRGELRSGIAHLLALCLLLPVTLVIIMQEAGWLGTPVAKREWLAGRPAGEGIKAVTNAQQWWALVLSMPVYLWLRRFTGSPALSMLMAVAAAAFSVVTLLRMGMLEWLENNPGNLYFHLIPVALLFFAVAILLERRERPQDSRYFYPFAVVFTYLALSGVAAFHEPYQAWLKSTFPWTRGQIEYLFLINASIYAALQWACDRVPTAQMRAVAKAFRFVLPGHVLVSLLLLGISAAEKPAWRTEARTFEVVLPLVALVFVFGSIAKQMKNFFVSGGVFLAIGLVRLQRDLLRDAGWWPVALLAAGMILMTAAVRYPVLKLAVLRKLGKKSPGGAIPAGE